jgi:large subunit ribosomal protein L18
MIKSINRKNLVRKRHYRLRRRLWGTDGKPRLAVYRSVKHIYAQIIDDLTSNTLVSANTLEADVRGKLKHGGNIDAAKLVGELIAKRAKDKGIEQVVFDRGGFLYHGRIAALADAAREAGLQF